MSKTVQVIAVSLLGLAHASFATAAGPAHSDNSETGTVYHNPEYKRVDGKLARTDTWNASRAGATSPSPPNSDANWEFVDGDSGWQLRQPSYDLRGNRIDGGAEATKGSPAKHSSRRD